LYQPGVTKELPGGRNRVGYKRAGSSSIEKALQMQDFRVLEPHALLELHPSLPVPTSAGERHDELDTDVSAVLLAAQAPRDGNSEAGAQRRAPLSPQEAVGVQQRGLHVHGEPARLRDARLTPAALVLR